MTDAELDDALRHAMRARPTPVPPFDLAARALALARVDALRRLRRWTALATALATAVAIAVVDRIVRDRLAGGGFSAWSDGSVATTDSSTPSWMWIGLLLTMSAVAIVAIRSAWDRCDEGWTWTTARRA